MKETGIYYILRLLLRSRYVHYWMSCAINKGSLFESAFVVVVDTHLPRFEALAGADYLIGSWTLAYVLRHFDALTHLLIPVS